MPQVGKKAPSNLPRGEERSPQASSRIGAGNALRCRESTDHGKLKGEEMIQCKVSDLLKCLFVMAQDIVDEKILHH